MSLPENYTPRKGDVLSLRMTVDWSTPGETPRVYGQLGDEEQAYGVDLSAADGVARYAFEPGDRVRNTESDQVGTVLAVHEQVLWTRYDDFEWPTTLAVADAIRIDTDDKNKEP